MFFFDLLFKKTDAISCSLIDQEDNVIFSKNKDSTSQTYKIEFKKLYRVIRLISKNFKTLLDYQTKIQTIVCSEINNIEGNGFFLLIKSVNIDKTLIAIFPSTTSHQNAFNKFKKTIKILSYYFSELGSPIIS